MWALDFLLGFLLIQLAAQVDSSGEHQGSACVILELCDTTYPPVVGQVWGWENTLTREQPLLANLAPFLD